MDHVDPQMAQRVWQRVQNAPQEDVLPLMLDLALSCAHCCMHLGKHFRGQEAELQRMRSQLLHQAACLRGIRYLRTGLHSRDSGAAAIQENPDNTLRRCLGQCLRLGEACRREAMDPEYGSVYAAMADQCTAHAQLLLSLAGK